MLFAINSKAEENNIKYYSEDSGILSLMYHRFDENKYPSTNIQMDIFKEQMSIINTLNYKFYDPQYLQKKFNITKNKKEILITKNGYMSWEQIQEIEKEPYAYIGNHSHSHDYLVDLDTENFLSDINTSIKIFNQHLGYNPIFFSYPFGEYSKTIKDFISKNFDFAFGQHSGVIDINKDPHELPRFPINEKYGDLERFKFLINLSPLQYKSLNPEDKYITNNNPPKLSVEFFENQKNIENINCFSDEGSGWDKSNITFNKNILKLNFREKFTFRRGRVNCSLNDNGIWRWFGVQFSVNQN